MPGDAGRHRPRSGDGDDATARASVRVQVRTKVDPTRLTSLPFLLHADLAGGRDHLCLRCSLFRGEAEAFESPGSFLGALRDL